MLQSLLLALCRNVCLARKPELSNGFAALGPSQLWIRHCLHCYCTRWASFTSWLLPSLPIVESLRSCRSWCLMSVLFYTNIIVDYISEVCMYWYWWFITAIIIVLLNIIADSLWSIRVNRALPCVTSRFHRPCSWHVIKLIVSSERIFQFAWWRRKQLQKTNCHESPKWIEEC